MTGVVVTGMGVVSSIGATREDFWAAALAGRNGVRPLEYAEMPPGQQLFGAQIRREMLDQAEFDPHLSAGAVFALVAAREAVAHAGLAKDGALHGADPLRCGSSLGSGTGNPRLTGSAMLRWKTRGLRAVQPWMTQAIPATAAGAAVAADWGLGGPHHVFTTSCMASNNAIAQAVETLRSGRADVMVAGGTEGLFWVVANGFRMLTTVRGGALECSQPFAAERRGVIVGEGAGILVLERREHAAARGARAYAEILGCGFGSDAFHMSTPHPEGVGGIAALAQALEVSGVTPEDVDYVSAHGTGSQANDVVETKILKAVFGARAARIPVSSIKSMIGHTLGAASAIEAIACVLAIRDSRIPPTINLTTPDPACDLDYVPNVARDHEVGVAVSNAFAFGGACSALVLRRESSLTCH